MQPVFAIVRDFSITLRRGRQFRLSMSIVYNTLAH